jgi:hypothetical protein
MQLFMEDSNRTQNPRYSAPWGMSAFGARKIKRSQESNLLGDVLKGMTLPAVRITFESYTVSSGDFSA